MKDSGIEWIGDIPEEWHTIKLKNVAKIITGNTPSKSDDSFYSEEGLSWVKPDNLDGFYGFTSTKEKLNSEGMSLARAVPKYTLLTCCIGTIGKFGYATEEVAFNQQINAIVFSQDKIYWKFGIYYMSVQDQQQKFYQNGNVVFILNTENQKRVLLTIPKLLEQQAIANYLDLKCSLIDSTIEKQKAVIEKLKHYKQSLITEAVTKGLDPTAKMKPSGIEWIGDIPKGWEVTKLKYFSKIDSEKLPENTDKDYEFDYIDIGSVGEFGNINQFERIAFGNSPSRARMIVQKGDIIISTVRTYLRAIAVIEESNKFIVSTGFAVIGTKDECYPKYFFYESLCEPIVQEIVRNSVGISYPAINTSKLREIKYATPPLSEQQAIANYLDIKCVGIDSVINGKQRLIGKLTAYKKSLIYECVTGKREV